MYLSTAERRTYSEIVQSQIQSPNYNLNNASFDNIFSEMD